MLHHVLLQMLLAVGQISTLETSESLDAIVDVHVFPQLELRSETLFAAWPQTFVDTRRFKFVSLHVLLEVLKAFDGFAAVAARQQINRVHVVLVRVDGFQILARVRAACDVAFERPLLRMPHFVLQQLTQPDETHGALVAFELLNVFVHLLVVFSEFVSVREKFFAFLIETLVDSGGVRVVSGHVESEILSSRDALVAQRTRVHDAAVHTLLVFHQIKNEFGLVLAAVEVARVRSYIRVCPHVLLQQALPNKAFAANVTREFTGGKVLLPVLLQFSRGGTNSIAPSVRAFDLAGNCRHVQLAVRFQEIGTYELLAAQLALVI
jgi:hypothetical protein